MADTTDNPAQTYDEFDLAVLDCMAKLDAAMADSRRAHAIVALMNCLQHAVEGAGPELRQASLRSLLNEMIPQLEVLDAQRH